MSTLLQPHRGLACLLLLAACNREALGEDPTRGPNEDATVGPVLDHDANTPVPMEAGPQILPVEIGTPDEVSSTTFLELAEGGDVQLQDGGQGGTHALLALRFSGFGNWIFYEVAIQNLDGEGRVATPKLVRPRPVPCDDEGVVCRMSPIFAVIGGLADRSDWDGLHVEITGRVWNEDGLEGMGTRRAILRR